MARREQEPCSATDGGKAVTNAMSCSRRKAFGRFRRHHYLITVVCFIVSFYIMSYVGFVDILRQRSFSYYSYPLAVNLVPVVRHVRRLWSSPNNSSFRLYSDISVHPINRANFGYRIPNRSRCPRGRVDLLVLVKTAVANRKHRSILRRTWMNSDQYREAKFVVCFVFLLGVQPNGTRLQASLDEEQRLNGDLVQSNFVDTYFNNTYKTMLGFRWAIENVPHARYLFFTDDDYYVNLWNLWRYVASTSKIQTSKIIAGFIWDSSMPMRYRFSKWRISLEEYPFVRWPAYPAAGSYVVSMNTAVDLYIGMHYTKYLRFDDVFLGIVAHKVEIDTMHDSAFVGSTLYPIERSTYSSVIACHMGGQPKLVLEAWEKTMGKADEERISTARRRRKPQRTGGLFFS